MWQIVVAFIGFDGLGFDFCGKTQHPFFIQFTIDFWWKNVYKFWNRNSLSTVLVIWVYVLMIWVRVPVFL